MTAPALYETTVVHVRRRQQETAFAHRSYLWLVDLDELPALPRWLAPLARFDPGDHGVSGASSIRAELDAWLAEHGVDLRGGRVLMLANARVAGYVFNPLTVFWCYRGDGELECVIAEVHNTYGGRHRYLLRPDERHGAAADKRFYVSPFLPMGGRYQLYVPEPGPQLSVNVTLRLHGEVALTAVLRGQRRPATRRTLLRLLLRYPLAPLRAAAAIRWHGISLWLRGAPVIPRPHVSEENAT